MKLKILNVLLFVLTFIAVTGLVSGANAGVDENSIYSLPNLHRAQQNVNELNIIVESLKIELEDEKNKAIEYDDPTFLDKLKDLKLQINELKFYNGFTDVRGPGIYLSVSDSTFDDPSIDIMDKIVHDVDITVLLNDLKSAGAEAIEVNSERIINISEVVCAGPILRINGEGVPAPFLIRAIGEPEELYKAVTEEGTYAYRLKNEFGMEVNANMSYYLTIGDFDGNDYEINFIESIQGTEIKE